MGAVKADDSAWVRALLPYGPCTRQMCTPSNAQPEIGRHQTLRAADLHLSGEQAVRVAVTWQALRPGQPAAAGGQRGQL